MRLSLLRFSQVSVYVTDTGPTRGKTKVLTHDFWDSNAPFPYFFPYFTLPPSIQIYEEKHCQTFFHSFWQPRPILTKWQQDFYIVTIITILLLQLLSHYSTCHTGALSYIFDRRGSMDLYSQHSLCLFGSRAKRDDVW